MGITSSGDCGRRPSLTLIPTVALVFLVFRAMGCGIPRQSHQERSRETQRQQRLDCHLGLLPAPYLCEG